MLIRMRGDIRVDTTVARVAIIIIVTVIIALIADAGDVTCLKRGCRLGARSARSNRKVVSLTHTSEVAVFVTFVVSRIDLIIILVLASRIAG